MESYRTAPQEVVLTYVREPEEVVLTYEAEWRPLGRRASVRNSLDQTAARPVRPLQPPMRSVPPRAVGLPPPPQRRAKPKKRRWPVVLVCLLAAALLVGLGVAAAYSAVSLWEDMNRAGPSLDGGYDGFWSSASQDKGVSMPSYPTGGDFRMTYRKDHGPALTPQQVYARVNPSVVAVITHTGRGGATGTGVIMSPDGYILTNYHVVEEGTKCEVLLYDGDYYSAEYVAGDYEKDLAVLKVDAEELPAAEFGDSDSLVVGDTVYAIGNPLGLELRGTMTDGIVSAINRDVDVDGITMTLIQTNAALNSGNSGGPLVNIYGQVIGINTIKMVATELDDTIEGLGFAIPISAGSYVVNSLVQFGEVRPEPVLGIQVMLELTILEDGTGGLKIQSVDEGLGGEAAGLQAGDYIVTVDGEKVSTTSDIYRARRRYQEGEELPMTVYRDGTYIDMLVPLMVSENG